MSPHLFASSPPLPQCIALLWRSIGKELRQPVNAASKDALVEAYAGSQILDVLEALSGAGTGVGEEDVSGPLFEMAAMLPPDAVTGLTQV